MATERWICGRHLAGFIALIAIAFLGIGCSASTELVEMQQQLQVIQRQLATIQQQSSNRGQVEHLESVLAATQQQLLKSRADAEADLQMLLSRIEQLVAAVQENTATVAEVASNTEDLRLAIVELQTIASRPRETVSQQAIVPPSSIYETAFQSFQNGEYQAALVGFRSFLSSSSNSENADNASYWIGECYFNLKQYRDAIDQFTLVRQRYPDSEKAPSALLRTGLAYLGLGQQDSAVKVLRSVMTDYPRSDEAVLAQRRLANLPSQ